MAGRPPLFLTLSEQSLPVLPLLCRLSPTLLESLVDLRVITKHTMELCRNRLCSAPCICVFNGMMKFATFLLFMRLTYGMVDASVENSVLTSISVHGDSGKMASNPHVCAVNRNPSSSLFRTTNSFT